MVSHFPFVDSVLTISHDLACTATIQATVPLSFESA